MSFEVDFSPIGNLAKTYNEARTKSVRERTLAELGQHFANGNIDYRGLGAKLFAIGEPRAGLNALTTAEQRDASTRWPAQPVAPPQAPNAPRPAAGAPAPGNPFVPGAWRGLGGFYTYPCPGDNSRTGPGGD
jgi:hypothetical protein